MNMYFFNFERMSIFKVLSWPSIPFHAYTPIYNVTGGNDVIRWLQSVKVFLR